MSVFGSIMSKVLGRTPASPVSTAQAAHAAPAAKAGTAPSSGQAASPASPPPGPVVDVAAVLEDLRSKNKALENLNWRQSIVDLMKLLSLDSSLAARKELAKELHYAGDTNDSSAMNIWLHKQIMKNLAANGGKLPDELKSLV